MPDSETFDAFYARTVWNVTGQMHELAGDNSMADHAIREAYAKAYQQWYQVSGYRDTEGWVLATAKDAYERRRAESAGAGRPAAEAGDSGTWPGFFRPGAQPGRHGGPHDQRLADPDGTLAPPRHGWSGGEGNSAAAPRGAAGISNYPVASAMAANDLAGNGTPAGAVSARGPATGTALPTRVGGVGEPGTYGPGTYGPGTYGPGPDGPGGGPGRGGPGGARPRPTSRRNLIVAGVAAVALVIAGIAYYASGSGHKAQAPTANQGTSGKPAAKPKAHMLAAGLTGRRSAIPWSLVGPGWALAEFSTAQPNAAGEASGTGGHRFTTYLVDPDGGKYKIATSAGGPEPELTAWSGNGLTALFAVGNGAPVGDGSYLLLNVKAGQFTQLPLPAGVVPTGFARPLGLAILAVKQGPAEFHLQRYTLTGQLQASLASLPRQAGETLPATGCSTACALSSPDGLTDVWGILGDGMQLLSNAGGKPQGLRVKDSGHALSCMPVTWWNDTAVLANCTAAGSPVLQQLWLVPDNGSAPTALTQPVPDTQGGISGAWLAGQTTYVATATSRVCPAAPSGPGGEDILPLNQGTSAAITVPGSTQNFSTIVATQGKRLLVLTQTECPGTSSLLWFNPSTGQSQTVISAPGNEVGVIAAVPFGNGPTAVSSGDY